jgi:hypothetical protein
MAERQSMRQHATVTICRTLYAGVKRLSLIGIKLPLPVHLGQSPDAWYLRFPMSLSKSLLVDCAIVLALILVGLAAYKFSPLLMPKVDVTVEPAPGCDLHRSSCEAILPGGGRLTFSLSPRPVAVMVPLEVAVVVEGVDADQVAVDFAGVSMNMGLNRQSLSGGGGRFGGQATLPVCVTGRMAWLATVLVETGRTRMAIPFRFDAGR